MDRHAYVPQPTFGAVGQPYSPETAMPQQESIRSAIERFAKIEDHLASLRDRLQDLRDSVNLPGPQAAGSLNSAKPPQAPGVIGSLHGLADAISDHTSAIDRLISEITMAVG